MSVSEQPCTSTRWLSIIGIGEDGIEGLSAAARQLIAGASLVVGGARHLELARSLIRGTAIAWPRPMAGGFDEIERQRGRPVVVLASGDPFYFGVGKQLAERFAAECLLSLPQPSAFSLAAARMGWAQQDTSCVTLHGRALAGLFRYVQPGARILALSWDGTTPSKVAAALTELGFGGSRLTVLEAMGGARERIGSATAAAFPATTTVSDLNTIAIECVAETHARVIPFAPGLDDALFESDGQLTKRDIRAVTLSALAPRQGERLWDIGLGAGSIAIEWLLRHPSLTAIGFEEQPERAARAARNAANLGTPDLEIVTGKAPGALKDRSPPDAVFIGGGFGDAGVFDAAWQALRPGGRLVANGVSLETEQLLLAAHGRLGGDLVRLEVARAVPIGSMFGWRPQMPVTQWRVVKP